MFVKGVGRLASRYLKHNADFQAAARLLTTVQTRPDSSAVPSNTWLFGAAAAGLITAGALGRTAECETSTPATSATPDKFSLISFEKRKAMFFAYERKLRERSTPEKVFEYFASVKNASGEHFMRPLDLLRAVVPVFQPFGSTALRCGSLPGEPTENVAGSEANSPLFAQFIPGHARGSKTDATSQGLISYDEFIFFVTLLSIPLKDVRAAFLMFDEDGSGALDHDEFVSMMRVLRQRSRKGEHAASHETLKAPKPGSKAAGALSEAGAGAHFFGASGRGSLPRAKFEAFLKELNAEMVRLEFLHYCGGEARDKKRGSAPQKLSARDFALSLVAAADGADVDAFLERVRRLPADAGDVTLAQFTDFHRIRWHLDELRAAVGFYADANGVSPDTFKRAVKRVCGVELGDGLVRVVFHVFDSDGDGSLSNAEFFDFYERHVRGDRRSDVSGVGGLLECCRDCYRRAHSGSD